MPYVLSDDEILEIQALLAGSTGQPQTPTSTNGVRRGGWMGVKPFQAVASASQPPRSCPFAVSLDETRQ